jgi:hypothetical protein
VIAVRRKRLATDQLTLGLLRSKGWICDLAERRQGPISRDFLGFADVVALDEEGRPVAVQHTGSASSGGNMAARRRKILANGSAHEWVARGGRVVLLCWRSEIEWDSEELTCQLGGLA